MRCTVYSLQAFGVTAAVEPTCLADTRRELEKAGYVVTEVPDVRGVALGVMIKKLRQTGDYIVCMPGHQMALKDGALWDTGSTSMKWPVRSIHRVDRIPATA